jgi:hypothetical protein
MIGHGKPIELALVGESPEPTDLVKWTTEVPEVYPEPNTRNRMGLLSERETTGYSFRGPVPRKDWERRWSRRCPRRRKPR